MITCTTVIACTGNELREYTEIVRWVRQTGDLSQNLFHLYSQVILMELVDLPGFIIDERNVNSIKLRWRYLVDGIFRKDTERIIAQGSQGKEEERREYEL